MSGLVVFVAVIVVVLGLLWFAWTQRSRALGRGIGGAGAAFNATHGYPESPLQASAVDRGSPSSRPGPLDR